MNRECAVMTNSWIDTARNMDFDIFCNICFENINISETGSSSGTKLLQCCHIFCDNCWRSHLRTKLKNGGVTITCPGYECEEVVDSATLLSLLHVSDVNKLLQREREIKVKTSPICKWCPNPNCGRVMRLDSVTLAKDFSVDVTCSCGNEVCFSCLSRPHWPAKCHQAKDYMSNRLTLASEIETKDGLNSQDLLLKLTLLSRKDSQVLEIEGRSCPNCSEFLQRNGGSTQMNCKCGHMFCWTCLKPYRTHTFCIPYASFIFSYAQKIITFSNDLSPTNESTNFARNKLCKVDTRYKKAQQQRLESNQVKLYKQIKEILEKIARITHKDLQLKREILSICKVKIDNTDETIISPCSFIPHVLKFLRSCHEIKLALHHVAEFTFVLLQDAPDSVDKRGTFRLANDLSAYCNFMKTILESGEKEDMRTAIRRLADIQIWAKEAIVANISSINRLKRETTH